MTATSAKQWVETQKEVLPLPSGNTAILKKADLIDLLAQGAIPDTLTGQVEQLLNSGQGKMDLPLDQFEEFAKLLDKVALACFVQPRLVADQADENLEENILWVGNVKASDKIYIFEWANKESEQVTPFRPQSTGAMAALQLSHNVQTTSLGPGGADQSLDQTAIRPSNSPSGKSSGKRPGRKRGQGKAKSTTA